MAPLYAPGTRQHTLALAYTGISALTNAGCITVCAVQVQSLEAKPGSLQDLTAAIYAEAIWLLFGADSGGKSTKWMVEVGATGPHMAGLFRATDSYVNNEAFMRVGKDWVEQLRTLGRGGAGLRVRNLETGEVRVMKVEVFVNGDYAFLYSSMGHQGGAATFPSLRDLTPSAHLRKAHRDGSPHHPGIAECSRLAVPRPIESFDEDYMANLMDTRGGGDLRKNGHRHHSIIGRPLVSPTSTDHIVVASLHIGLAVTFMEVLYLQHWCAVLSGITTATSLARIGSIADPQVQHGSEQCTVLCRTTECSAGNCRYVAGLVTALHTVEVKEVQAGSQMKLIFSAQKNTMELNNFAGNKKKCI